MYGSSNSKQHVRSRIFSENALWEGGGMGKGAVWVDDEVDLQTQGSLNQKLLVWN